MTGIKGYQTQRIDKINHLLGQKEIREKYPVRVSHALSENDSSEVFSVRWEPNRVIIERPVAVTSSKGERREWLKALIDAIENELWGPSNEN